VIQAPAPSRATHYLGDLSRPCTWRDGRALRGLLGWWRHTRRLIDVQSSTTAAGVTSLAIPSVTTTLAAPVRAHGVARAAGIHAAQRRAKCSTHFDAAMRAVRLRFADALACLFAAAAVASVLLR
jgi:hypothetical protein